ncbi:hypothetical protein MPSEU_000934900 [Mayamaea pseudoterrestris]|nr:hypothetical protein MPSEU_000934900 [Mayamaea pseudoterrestris]
MLKQSVIDYAKDPEDSLLRDLLIEELRFQQLASAQSSSSSDDSSKQDTKDSFAASMSVNIEEIGWIISNCDEDSSEAVTAQDEFERLNVLKKYSAMDLDNDEALKAMTTMVSSMLGHEYSWVLLMDLRKSWIVSAQGLGGMSECPRNQFFPCAHVLRSQNPCLVVNDLVKDPRFVKSPFAIGPLGARFYAAAPLISPEGFRIGVFGVASRRPSTMSATEQEFLTNVSNLAMQHLVDRRRRLDLEENLKKAVACTSHDIMTPLMGLQLSLSSLREDQELNSVVSEYHRDLLTTADNCATTMCQLGTTAMQNIHESLAATEADSAGLGTCSRGSEYVCQVADLVDRLHQTLDPIEKNVPLMITVDPSTPPTLAVSDLKIFRAALAILCLACARTRTGFVLLKISMVHGQVVFACESSMPALESNETASFIDTTKKNKDDTIPCLLLAAKTISSLGGTCNYRPGQTSVLSFKIPGADTQTSSCLRGFELAAARGDATTTNDVLQTTTTQSPLLKRPLLSIVSASAPSLFDLAEADPTMPRKRKVLVIDDSLVVRKSLHRALSTKFGYEVTLAEDGKEGLARLQETVFDFVLCDFLMPVMDGWDCTQQYRQWESHHRPWFRQLIIGMSAHAGDKDVQRASQFGMDDYKCKPVTIKVLTELSEDLKINQIKTQLDYLLPLFGTRTTAVANSPANKRKRTTSILCLTSNLVPDSLNATEEADKDMRNMKNAIELGKPVCLVCRSSSAASPWSTIAVTEAFQQQGWMIEKVQSSNEAMTRLKQRNYDAVIVDSELSPVPGVACIATFREWESSNRVNRQKNVLLQFPANSALSQAMRESDSAIVQPPSGFDGVIGGQSVWADFNGVVGSPVADGIAQVTGIVMR